MQPVRYQVIVEFDLSASSAASGPGNISYFRQNISAVRKAISAFGPCSSIAFFGITDSLEVFQIGRAAFGCDAGYFNEVAQGNRAMLAKHWDAWMANIKPSYPDTDVLGALFVASDAFRDCENPRNRCILLIWSDLRHHTQEFDLEKPAVLQPEVLLQKVKRNNWVAPLKGIEVRIFGVHSSGKSLTYWLSLRSFWQKYLELAGARLLFRHKREAWKVWNQEQAKIADGTWQSPSVATRKVTLGRDISCGGPLVH